MFFSRKRPLLEILLVALRKYTKQERKNKQEREREKENASEKYRHAKLNDLHICFRISRCGLCVYLCTSVKRSRSIPKLIIPTRPTTATTTCILAVIFFFFTICCEVTFSFIKKKKNIFWHPEVHRGQPSNFE